MVNRERGVKTTRRRFVQGLGAIAPVSLLDARLLAAAEAASRDYFAELGLEPFVNAIGPYSSLGGAEMWPEVIRAMDYAATHKARMSELHDAVGRRIAGITGADAAMVTAGATCAMMLGVAACMAGDDQEKIERLPGTEGMPSEIIMLSPQRYLYDRSLRAPGATLTFVDTAADVRAAIGPQTAMLFFLQNRQDDLEIGMHEFLAIGKEHGIPVMCDAATTVPPVSRMRDTIEAGFDLVCYSGGKGLRGPYSAGLLLGRPDLIRAARLNGSPHHRSFGRSMKVSAEEYLGMMVAVEKSFGIDEGAEYQRQLEIIQSLGRRLETIPGVTVTTDEPDYEAREPYIAVEWDAARYPIEPAEVKQALRDGDPCVEIRALFLSGGRIEMTAVMLKPGEDAIVAARFKDVLTGNASRHKRPVFRPAPDRDETAGPGRDYFADIGVKPVLNAAGAYSALGGARMRPEVMHAMSYAAINKVKVRDLHDAVGERIATLTGADAAMVTSGATAAIVLATAACMTRGDKDAMQRLPDARGMRNQVIIQKRHRYTYDRALWVAGAELVEVESEADVREVASERTAMMFFLKPTQVGHDIEADRYMALARELGIPSFCDAATTTPPARNVIDGVSEGFDLICYSGGKGLRGPYSAGLLLGRADLIAFAREHAAPNDQSIGRGMKVSIEEYLGMLIALEAGLQVDEQEEAALKRRRFTTITNQLAGVPGVRTEVVASEGETGELYLDVDWDPALIPMSRADLIRALKEHDPAVEVRLPKFSGGRVHLSATVLGEGEDQKVGAVMKEILQAAAKRSA
jgi:L-seryl-tRNA(Ser) seleniumtransferase